MNTTVELKRYTCSYCPGYGIGDRIKFVDGYFPPLDRDPVGDETIQSIIENHKWYGTFIFEDKQVGEEDEILYDDEMLMRAAAIAAKFESRNRQEKFTSIADPVEDVVAVTAELTEEDEQGEETPPVTLVSTKPLVSEVFDEVRKKVSLPKPVPTLPEINKMMKRQCLTCALRWNVEMPKAVKVREAKQILIDYFKPFWQKGISEV